MTTLPDIPVWKKDDYQTTEPFEWLYAFKDNKFVMLQLRDAIKERAGLVGVKNFVTKWNAFLQEKRKSEGLDVENVTMFDGQPEELYSGEYSCDDSGVTYIDYAGREVIVCRHPIMPVQRLVNVDTGEVKLEIAFKRGHRWQFRVFDKTTLASSNRIVELSKVGIAVDSESSKELVRYLTFLEAENYDKIPETSSVGRCGWIPQYGFAPYVEDLKYDGDLSYQHMFESIQANGDYDEWLKVVKDVRKTGHISKIVLASSFASVLVEPLGGLPFFTHIWGGTEAGKAQPLDTKIITPDGYKLMGDIKVGDKVVGCDGKPHFVTGVYPQGVKDVYEVTFGDGTSTRCCKEHLWTVSTRTRRSHKRGYTVMSLEDIMKTEIKTKKGYNYRIPVCAPVEYETTNTLPIHPYVLGSLIGDGCLTLKKNLANGSVNIYFSNVEDDVIAKVDGLLKERDCYLRRNEHTQCQMVVAGDGKKELINDVRSLGLDCKSNFRFIPEVYLMSSIEDRKSLLAGLFDTDGSVDGKGKFSYSTKSERLANDVEVLCRSLGYRTTKHEDGRGCFSINILTDAPVYTSVKHADRHAKYLAKRNRAEDKRSIPIVDIRLVGREECQCIMVDSVEHTYLCDDFIVTHNTVGLMLAASVWANPSLGSYIHTFNSTNVGQEMMAGFCNSLPLCLDELQCIKDRRDFDKTIYMLTEGIGKGRGAKAGGLQRVQTWKNCMITTGEQPITTGSSGGGAVNRIIEVDCKDEKLFKDPQTVADTVRRHYGYAGRIFIEQLTEDMDFARDAYKRFYGLLSQGSSTEKQAMAGAMILTADYLADQWIFQDGNTIDTDDLKQYLTDKADVDANLRAAEWIEDFVASNQDHFDPDNERADKWGVIRDGYICIIKSVFDREMANEGFNASAFLSWAKRRGVLDTDKNRTTKKKLIGKLHPWCVCIKQQDVFCEESTSMLD